MKTYVFTNRVYPPVGGATGELLKELAEGLVADGTRVIVVTSRPEEDKRLRDQGTAGGRRSEPERSGDSRRQTGGRRRVASQPTDKGLKGEEPETAAAVGDRASPVLAGRGQTKRSAIINGVEVIRVGVASFTRASHWRRAWSYLTLYPQLMWQVWKLGKVDAVVSMTDPPLQVAAVTMAACRAGRKIHWAQDVYPELAEELGVIRRGGFLARVLRAVSNWALRRQDDVVAVGRCMRERLVRRGVDAGKIEVIPNWSSVGAVSEEEVRAMREKLGWNGKFIALYSGNIGLAHDFETLVGAAKLLEGAGVQMVFAGEGPRREEVRHATEGMAHVSFLPPQAKGDLSAFLAAADVHLVSVRAGLEGLVVPSKAYGIVAVERPIFYVGSADSEVASMITESGCGMVTPNGDASGLAEAIKQAARQGGQHVGAHAVGFENALAKWREILS
jgi:colanic acid biosynthesis glycosyl transferase WcaI